jgi:uncharacterized protein (UPF0264 family)
MLREPTRSNSTEYICRDRRREPLEYLVSKMHVRNRKLLVSVFNAQEVREAILGGGRIIDSEDPRSALGNIKPCRIMSISDAALSYRRDLDVQLSTNIGEDQLLFDQSETGEAIKKSAYEIAGKAAQAAIGVACSMGNRVHPCNFVKVGLDGMNVELVKEVLGEVVLTLSRTEQYSHCQVMSVLFAQDILAWARRQSNDSVRKVLVELCEFHSCDEDDPEGFDLQEYASNTLRDRDDRVLFAHRRQVSLRALVEKAVLPAGIGHSIVKVNALFPHRNYYPSATRDNDSRTTKSVIKAMVDATANAGAHAIMIDTRIQSKVARICIVDTACDGMVDINRFDVSGGLTRQGILTLDDIRYFVEYCHYRNLEANVAGSVQSYQAQQLWLKVPELDQISTRGSASGISTEPRLIVKDDERLDTRHHRKIKRHLVRGMAPPEHGGVLNIPISMRDNNDAKQAIRELREELSDLRRRRGLPDLECFYVDRHGTPIHMDS